ncbi:AAA family ATPase [Promicromonospora aerolata]|uniref:AAA family ATPase n=1 Tax=Promicromonospora aerolata TaxID=195749 RepID=A0ABW4VC87_9MICO
MEHLSEVLKILEGALRHDPSGAREYALLLADKLEDERRARQAEALRRTIARMPGLAVQSTEAAAALPRDDESDTPTVDIEQPLENNRPLALPRFVRQQLDEFVQTVEKRDLWVEHGIDTPARLLLVGLPGTGKTQTAREVARNLGLPIVMTRSDVLVSSFLGQTSKNIRRVFEYASSRPCVLFLDELDAIAKRRDDSQEVGELQRVVIALLQNLDALPESTVVLAATNHPELLDRAIGRRFAFHIDIPLPAAAQRAQIWADRLGSHAPPPEDIDILASVSEGMSGAVIEAAALDARRQGVILGHDVAPLTLILRRLARMLWYEDHQVFESPEAEMIALRRWLPKVFTYRELSEQFDVTTRQVGNAVRSRTEARADSLGAHETQ